MISNIYSEYSQQNGTNCSDASSHSPLTSELYKTDLCKHWKETGTCQFGSSCMFAHGTHDLRVVLKHPKFKTDLCMKYASTGYCPYGLKCDFVHEIPSCSVEGPQGQTVRLVQTTAQVVKKTKTNPEKYKTRHCRKWSETGKCPYGPRCQYLHGCNDPFAPRTHTIKENNSQSEVFSTWSIPAPSSPTNSQASTCSSGCDRFSLISTDSFSDVVSESSDDLCGGSANPLEWKSDCSICFSSGADCKLRSCGHKFHGYCALRWLRKSEYCPICHALVDDIEPIFKEPEFMRSPPNPMSFSSGCCGKDESTFASLSSSPSFFN